MQRSFFCMERVRSVKLTSGNSPDVAIGIKNELSLTNTQRMYDLWSFADGGKIFAVAAGKQSKVHRVFVVGIFPVIGRHVQEPVVFPQTPRNVSVQCGSMRFSPLPIQFFTAHVQMLRFEFPRLSSSLKIIQEEGIVVYNETGLPDVVLKVDLLFEFPCGKIF